jgi:predicted RNA-binding Zn-ribbon protein involved in translation (DUF1610 family)
VKLYGLIQKKLRHTWKVGVTSQRRKRGLKMTESAKTSCPKCGVELDYKAVTKKEMEQPHEPGTVGAYCGQCGAKLIAEG